MNPQNLHDWSKRLERTCDQLLSSLPAEALAPTAHERLRTAIVRQVAPRIATRRMRLLRVAGGIAAALTSALLWRSTPPAADRSDAINPSDFVTTWFDAADASVERMATLADEHALLIDAGDAPLDMLDAIDESFSSLESLLGA